MTAPKANVSAASILMGTEPINPVGLCFDSAAATFVAERPTVTPDERLCHGVGLSNFPGQEGHVIGHAWLEFDHPRMGRMAYDTTWGIHVPADKYRRDLKVSHCVEYTLEEALLLWGRFGTPGPWDPLVKDAVGATKGAP